MRTITGTWIKELREELDMTQSEFAIRLNVSQGAVANWENGKRQVSGPAVIILENLDLERRRLADKKIPA